MKYAMYALGMLCFAAPEPSYRITGVVVHALTGTPISQAQVVLGPTDQPGTETAAATTASDGRFAFDKLPAGKWSLFAERKGFPRQAYLQRPEPGSPGVTIVTGSAPSENLVFPMTPPAVIRGRVTDGDGNPVARAVIQVMTMPLLGYKAALPLKAERADERGEYRIWDLPAASCYVVAVPQRADPSGSLYAAPYEHQWYPNTPDARAAIPIALKPGEEFTADFVLKRARGASVNVPGRSGAEGIILAAEGPAGSDVPIAALGPGQKGSAFRNLLPGRYKLQVFTMGAAGPEMRARQIEVGREDVNVPLPLPEPPAVSAIVRVANANSELVQKMGVILRPDSGNPVYGEKTGPAGGMIFPGVVMGRHRVVIGGAPELYTQSIAAEGARVANGFVDVPEQGAVVLKIVASGDGGRVRGRVRVDGKPAAGVLVVLAPRQESDNTADYYGGQTESDGGFDFLGVRPGEYVLFATANWQLEFRMAAAVRGYLERGHAVRLAPKSTVEVNLTEKQ